MLEKQSISLRHPKNLTPLGLDEEDEDDDDEDDGLGVSPEDLKAEKLAEAERTARKRAGIPELELDALPSAIATKMLSLVLKLTIVFDTYIGFSVQHPPLFGFTICWVPKKHATKTILKMDPVRTCVSKRQKKLQDGFERFEDADTLSQLQTQLLVYLLPFLMNTLGLPT